MDNNATVHKRKNGITACKVLDSAQLIIYRFADDFDVRESFVSGIHLLKARCPSIGL